MDLNELQGKVLKVNLARHTKAPIQGLGNRAGSSKFVRSSMFRSDLFGLVWESEEWLKDHAKPLSESGGPFSHLRP